MIYNNIAINDICLPDYFSGHTNPVLYVSIYKDMTKIELTESLLSELNDGYIESYNDEYEIDYDSIKTEIQSEGFILSDKPFIDTIEESGNFEVVAHFVLIEE
ncbi:MAG: hypothetical protein HOG49_21690 [Candidatus Scalindua sp.]|jgi:hypothetical protein|nr:hypothetical protein [Candidatus Scalindua sp.]